MVILDPKCLTYWRLFTPSAPRPNVSVVVVTLEIVQARFSKSLRTWISRRFSELFPATWVEGMSTARRNGRARYPPTTWNIRVRTLMLVSRTNNPTGFIAGMRLQQAISDNMMVAIAVGDKPPCRNNRDCK